MGLFSRSGKRERFSKGKQVHPYQFFGPLTPENMMKALYPLLEKYAYLQSLIYSFGCSSIFLPHFNLGLEEELTSGKSKLIGQWFSGTC